MGTTSKLSLLLITAIMASDRFVLTTYRNIVVGLCNGIAPLDSMPHWGYHGNDGTVRQCGTILYDECERYGQGDTIGCGVDERNVLYFTKNGKMLGMSLRRKTPSADSPQIF